MPTNLNLFVCLSVCITFISILSQGLLKDMEKGQSLLKSAREKGERALKYLEDAEAETLRKEIHDHVERLKELTSTVRKEHTGWGTKITYASGHLSQHATTTGLVTHWRVCALQRRPHVLQIRLGAAK